MLIACLDFLFYLIKSDFAVHPFQSDYRADQFPEEKQPVPSPGRAQKVLKMRDPGADTQLTPLNSLSWLMQQAVDSKSEKAKPVVEGK